MLGLGCANKREAAMSSRAKPYNTFLTAILLFNGGKRNTAMSLSKYSTGNTANWGKKPARPSAPTTLSRVPSDSGAPPAPASRTAHELCVVITEKRLPVLKAWYCTTS